MSKEYPSTLPLVEIQNVISIVRNREIADKKQEFAQDAWYVQGYLQGVLVGSPTTVKFGCDGCDCKAEDFTELQEALTEVQKASNAPNYGVSLAAMGDQERGDMSIIISLIIPAILQLIEQLRKRS